MGCKSWAPARWQLSLLEAWAHLPRPGPSPFERSDRGEQLSQRARGLEPGSCDFTAGGSERSGRSWDGGSPRSRLPWGAPGLATPGRQMQKRPRRGSRGRGGSWASFPARLEAASTRQICRRWLRSRTPGSGRREPSNWGVRAWAGRAGWMEGSPGRPWQDPGKLSWKRRVDQAPAKGRSSLLGGVQGGRRPGDPGISGAGTGGPVPRARQVALSPLGGSCWI